MSQNNTNLSQKEQDFLLKYCAYDLKEKHPINTELNPAFSFLKNNNMNTDPKLKKISKDYFKRDYTLNKYNNIEMNYIYNTIRNYFLTKQLSHINFNIQNNKYHSLSYNNLKGFICSQENETNYLNNFQKMPNEILAILETNRHLLENLDKDFYDKFKILAPKLKKEINELEIQLWQADDEVVFEKPNVINKFPEFYQPFFHYELDAYMHRANMFFWFNLYENEINAYDGDWNQQNNLKNFFDYTIYRQFHQSSPEEIEMFFETKDKNKIKQLKQILQEQENRQIYSTQSKQKHL